MCRVVRCVVIYVTKNSGSIGRKETALSESSVRTSVVNEEKSYTSKDVLGISLLVGLVMMGMMYLFLTSYYETDRDARMQALTAMCRTYAQGGEPFQVYNDTGSFTVVCRDRSVVYGGFNATGGSWDCNVFEGGCL